MEFDTSAADIAMNAWRSAGQEAAKALEISDGRKLELDRAQATFDAAQADLKAKRDVFAEKKEALIKAINDLQGS